MINFFKNILGISPNSGEGSGSDNAHSNNYRNDFWEGRAGNNKSNEENHITIISEENVNAPGIPMFNDPFEIHKFVEQFFDRMFDSSEIFRMPLGSIFFSEGKGGTSSQFSTDSSVNSPSLRDSFLKTPDSNTGIVKKKDIDLDGKVTADDVENYLNEESNITPRSFFPNFNIFIHHNGDYDDGGDDDHGENVNNQENVKNFKSFSQSPNFKFYSKSVYVESVVNPDGSIKIIKKVQDSNGNEETIIEDKYSSNIPNDQLLPPDDISGVSIFKKFFPF